jgi:hypothetical protein
MSRVRVPYLLIAVSASLPLLHAACSSEGKTPTCPPLPLYDVRDAGAREAAKPALLAAKNCTTLPVGLEGGASN